MSSRIRLEKAAADCGFERTPTPRADGGLTLCSAQFPATVTVYANPSGYRIWAEALSADVIEVDHLEQLYATLQQARAAAMSNCIGDSANITDQFRAQTLHLPQTTEAERLVVQRVGQDLFRHALLEYWQGKCCVTGLAVSGLLRASHIKPWAKCVSDHERLDIFNGLLLAPHLDALFDGGWISFSNQGSLLVSTKLPDEAKAQLGMPQDWTISGLTSAHLRYLTFHRTHELRQAS